MSLSRGLALAPMKSSAPSLATPAVRVIADSLDISRDSSRIVTALARPESDIWLVERE
jgi:hypothetical protein